MSKTNAFETDLLGHIFTNAAIAGLGDASGLQPSAVAGNLYISLHTADPGEAGTQATSEVAYASYARVAVARDSYGWTLAGNQVQNASPITFPTGTGGTGTATHLGIGTSASGAGKLIYIGALAPSIVCGNGVTPIVPAATLTITED